MWKHWWKTRTLWNLLAKRKTYGRETETEKKEKRFSGPKRYFLDLLKVYKVMCEFSLKGFDADKTVQYIKLRKEMTKKYEFVQLKLLSSQELIYQFRRGRNLKEK